MQTPIILDQAENLDDAFSSLINIEISIWLKENYETKRFCC